MFKWFTSIFETNKVPLGKVFAIQNKNKKWNENRTYYVVACITEDGDEFTLMLTQNELEGARQRTSRNLEDVPAELIGRCDDCKI